MKNKICVYAIAKNEEQFVDSWCESAMEADAVVVLDTGSTDNTVEKLREHGVMVETKTFTPWRFDDARNESMKLIPEDCNILVCIDLDERFEPGWANIIRDNWIERTHERVWYMYTWSHDCYGNNARNFVCNKIHSRDWKWQYPVHELLRNIHTNSEDCDREKCLDLSDQVHLHHYPDMNKSRASYLPLLKQRKLEDPNDYYGRIYLAHEYYYREYYKESIQELKDILQNPLFKEKLNQLDKASCYLFMGDSYSALGECNKAILAYHKAIDIDETYREPYINLAKIYLSQKRYSFAEGALKTAIQKSYRHYSWLERDLSWTYEPYDLLTLACYYNNNKKESIVYAAKALSYCPEDERLKNNLRLCVKNTLEIELV